MLRTQRFKIGDEVLTPVYPQLDRIYARKRARIVALVLSGEVDLALGGGVNDVYHALYKVKFDWNGFDAPQPATYDEFFDWELAPCTEK